MVNNNIQSKPESREISPVVWSSFTPSPPPPPLTLNNIYIYTLLLAGALCFASCDDEEPILP